MPSGHAHSLLPPEEGKPPAIQVQEETGLTNLFVAYVSRLHQVEVRIENCVRVCKLCMWFVQYRIGHKFRGI